MPRDHARRWVAVAALTAALAAALPAAMAPAAPRASAREGFDLEGHRGTRGLRPENTLAAFGKALQVGVTTLELDTGVTKDGQVVVSHERRISPLECKDTGPATPADPSFPYVGKLIRDLTLAQLKTLDCGTRTPPNPATDPFLGTQESVPGTRMPTLAEVFDLADRYGARDVQFNIETKLDPTVDDTVAPEQFVARVAAVIEAHGTTARSLLQTFDWRTLVVARERIPELRLVALAQKPTIYPGTPWTAGLEVRDADPFASGEVAELAKRIGATVLSPRAQDVTDTTIERAHRLGLRVVPWTVNEQPDMRALIERGVDGLISDYPDRLRSVMRERGMMLPPRYDAPFDVEGHRGARTYRPENTLPAFAYGLDHGVDTLELDTGLTKDGHLVVLHDRRINGVHCTGPDVGALIRDLTLAQVKAHDCGHTDPGFPQQVPQPGARIPTLQEVFDLVRERGDERVRFNIETKLSPLVDDTQPYDRFTRALVEAIESNHLEDRAMIQSFDWRTIMLAKQLDPRIETVALVWQFAGADCDALDDECSLEAVMGDPSVISPWTGGLDWWDTRDLGRLVSRAHADVVSSNWQVHDPDQGHVASTDWYAKEDPAIYHGPSVATLQAKHHLRVVPYTVDDERTMQRVVDLGVDGIISDDVDLLVRVAKRNGLD
jgi:glycerophosphoryl diester phosphodiesterase